MVEWALVPENHRSQRLGNKKSVLQQDYGGVHEYDNTRSN